MLLQGLLFLAVASLFPVDGLEPRIDFWKSIFSTYGEHHLIVHDRIHVHLIYDVLDLKKLGISLNNKTAQNKLKREAASRIQDALSEICSKPREEWSSEADRINGLIRTPGLEEDIPLLRERVHIQRGVKERFQSGLKRYQKYRSVVNSTLKKKGLPLELAALPLVESGYNNKSRSRTGAAGIWQFMPGTARYYMKVNRKTDQRLDPRRATLAAANLLSSNYETLGNWPLAIMAYNHGTDGTATARDQCGDEISNIIQCYKGPSFGYASMNFYAEFMAASELLREHLSVTAPKDERYIVKSGDTLTLISRKFGTTLSKLVSLNRLSDPHMLSPGQVLLIR
jgi:membrane-bound lytic murein transglycosylase D